jgi:uncharacterized protein DUF3261
MTRRNRFTLERQPDSTAPAIVGVVAFTRSLLHFSSVTAVVLLLTSCAEIWFEPVRIGLKLPPSALGASISLHQQLTVERGGRADALEVALEVDPEHLNLIGIAFSQRVLTLHYDGRVLTSWRHSLLPDELRAEDVLEDVQLTLWPADAIRQALPAGWRLEENGLRRTLYAGETAVTAIEYSGEPRWNGTIELYNLRYHYRLVIQSVANGS